MLDMSPELINAIKERISAGQKREEIESAVIAMGHTKEVFAAAFTLAEHDIKEGNSGSLPKARTLFTQGWNFTQAHPYLILLLFIPSAIEVLASAWFGYTAESIEVPPLPLLGLFIVLGLAYVVVVAMTLFIVVKSDTEKPTLEAALSWTIKNAVPLLIVFILSGLVILGGLVLFFIPGIVVAIAITFSQYAYISDNKRGMDALLASRAAVKGRWFKVARKIFGLIILTIIPMILFGMVYGIIAFAAPESKYMTIGGELLTQLLSSVMSVISIHAMYHLYLALKSGSDKEVSVQKSARIRYWILALLTFILGAILVALAVFFEDKMEWLEDAAVPLEEMESREVPATFSQFSATTLQYANEHNGSFAGVCEPLRLLVEGEGEVICNDSETAWALETTDSLGNRFCADTATPGKVIAAPIGTQTECISVAE
jgi:MFS family permease